MTAKHTKGPHAIRWHDYVTTANGVYVSQIEAEDIIGDFGAALALFIADAERQVYSPIRQQAIDKARDAIAEAEGR